MRRLCAELGDPQEAFTSLHVVGTNGKSSVTLMCAAMLDAAGIPAGACVSPHLSSWRERVRIGGQPIGSEPFDAAVERVVAAIGRVEAEFDPGERITQFEAAIAASFLALAEQGIEVAVVEAGLGGRLDATNVMPSSATALTSVALDHTEWLGSTLGEIATEKLAVLRAETTLVVGRLDPPILELAARRASECTADLIVAPELPDEALPEGFPPYLRRNAAVAAALAEVVAPPLGPAATRAALASVELGGRAEVVPGDPPLILDAAHNEEGAGALAEALPELAAGASVIACVSILADKDAAAIVRALAPAIDAAVCCAAEPGPAMGRPGAQATDPEVLAGLFAAAGIESEALADPDAALARALELAGARGGVALCAGSHYLLRHAWTVKHDRSSSR
jgi:dihydrofolate synthase/folylpolyglutamate synthase